MGGHSFLVKVSWHKGVQYLLYYPSVAATFYLSSCRSVSPHAGRAMPSERSTSLSSSADEPTDVRLRAAARREDRSFGRRAPLSAAGSATPTSRTFSLSVPPRPVVLLLPLALEPPRHASSSSAWESSSSSSSSSSASPSSSYSSSSSSVGRVGHVPSSSSSSKSLPGDAAGATSSSSSSSAKRSSTGLLRGRRLRRVGGRRRRLRHGAVAVGHFLALPLAAAAPARHWLRTVRCRGRRGRRAGRRAWRGRARVTLPQCRI